MSTGICVIDRIIIAIAIQIQTVDGFGIQVGGIVGRDESTPFGAVVSGVAVVEASVVIVVVTTITDGVSVGNIVAGSLTGDGAVTPGVVQILGLQRAVGVVNGNHITLQVPLEIVEVAYTAGGQLHADDAVTDILPLCRPAVKKKPPRMIQEARLWIFVEAAAWQLSRLRKRAVRY